MMGSTNLPAIDRQAFMANARMTGYVGVYFTPGGNALRDWLIIKNYRCHPIQVLDTEELDRIYNLNTTHEINRLINTACVFKMEVRELMEYGPNGFTVPYRPEGYSREELAFLQQQYIKTHPHLNSASLSGLHRILEPHRRKTNIIIGPGGLSGFFKTVKEKEQA